MPGWIEELEEVVKGMGKPGDGDNDEDDGYDGGDEGDDEEEETPAPRPRTRKGVNAGVTDPKPNADTSDTDTEPSVHNPRSLDRRTGGGGIAAGGKGGGMSKSVTDYVDDDTADALEVSEVLGSLAKGIDSLAGVGDERLGKMERRMARFERGLEAIGRAVTKSLEGQRNLSNDLDAIGRKPAERRGVTKSVSRKLGGGEGDQAGTVEMPTASVLLQKSMAALKAGTLNAQDASRLETARQQGGWQNPHVQEIWNRING